MIQKQYEACADTVWSRYRLWLLLTGFEDLHWIEENHKVPKRKTKMGSRGVIC